MVLYVQGFSFYEVGGGDRLFAELESCLYFFVKITVTGKNEIRVASFPHDCDHIGRGGEGQDERSFFAVGDNIVIALPDSKQFGNICVYRRQVVGVFPVIRCSAEKREAFGREAFTVFIGEVEPEVDGM